MDTINIFLELSKFNNVTFFDPGHAYFIGNQQLTSGTSLYKPFQEEFQTEKQLEKKVKKNFKDQNIVPTAEQLETEINHLREEWLFANKHGRFEGTLIHKYLEGLFANKDVQEDRSMTYEGLSFSDIENTYFRLKKLAKRFYDTYVVTGILLPVRSEVVIGNAEMGVAGQIDQLFWDTRVNALVMYDWKTSTRVNTGNLYGKGNMKYCLEHLENCDFTKFSLQLSTYKYILESSTNIRLHKDFYVVWFNEQNGEGQLMKCQDLTAEVKDMIAFKKENPELFPMKPFTMPEIPETKSKLAPIMDDLLTF